VTQHIPLSAYVCVCSGVGEVQGVHGEEASVRRGRRWAECGEHQQGQKQAFRDGEITHVHAKCEIMRRWETERNIVQRPSDQQRFLQNPVYTHTQFYSLDFSVCVQPGEFPASFTLRSNMSHLSQTLCGHKIQRENKQTNMSPRACDCTRPLGFATLCWHQ